MTERSACVASVCASVLTMHETGNTNTWISASCLHQRGETAAVSLFGAWLARKCYVTEGRQHSRES